MAQLSTANTNTKKENKEMMENLNHRAEEAAHTLRETAEHAGQKAREFYEEKSEQAAEMRQGAEKTISAHPWQSVAIAALGGLVIGALLRR